MSVGDLGGREVRGFETVKDYLSYCVDEYYNLKHYCLGYVKTLEGFSDDLKELLTPPLLCYGLYSYYLYGNQTQVRFVDMKNIQGTSLFRFDQMYGVNFNTPVQLEETTQGYFVGLYNIGVSWYIRNLYGMQRPAFLYDTSGHPIWWYIEEDALGTIRYQNSATDAIINITTSHTPYENGYYYKIELENSPE